MLAPKCIMSRIITPEDLLSSQVEEFNKGNIDFLMTLYEKDACFASTPGQVVNDKESFFAAVRYYFLFLTNDEPDSSYAVP